MGDEATKNNRKKSDLTQGNLWKQLIFFALPLLASSLIQQLYSTVDLIFVGHFLGKEASAAIGSSSLLITCVIGFFTGMSIGANVLAATFFGSKQYDELKALISTIMLFGMISGIILTVIGYFSAPFFLKLMHTPDDIYAISIRYLRIYFISLVPIALYNIGAGILRGMGNSKSPTIAQFIGGLVNVLGNILFVGYFNFGITGAALTTVFSQTIAMVLVCRKICLLDKSYALQPTKMSLKISSLKKILIVGMPAALQAIIVTLSNLIVQSNINSLGVDTIVGFTAYFKVELFIYLPIVAIGQANITFVGQNIGAGKMNRAVKGTRASIVLGLLITLFTSALLLLFPQHVLQLFTKEASVLAVGMEIMKTTIPFYVLYVFLEVFASFIRGTGRSLPPTLIILFNMCLIRPLYVTLMIQNNPTPRAISFAYPITWFTTSVCLFLYYLHTKKAFLFQKELTKS